MPFDERWFYGDTLFIIDPWIWLGLGGALFLVTSTDVLRLVGWLLGAMHPAPWSGRSMPVSFREAPVRSRSPRAHRRASPGNPPERAGGERLHGAALVLVATYVILMVALSAYARRWTLESCARRGARSRRDHGRPDSDDPFLPGSRLLDAVQLPLRYAFHWLADAAHVVVRMRSRETRRLPSWSAPSRHPRCEASRPGLDFPGRTSTKSRRAFASPFATRATRACRVVTDSEPLWCFCRGPRTQLEDIAAARGIATGVAMKSPPAKMSFRWASVAAS